MALAVFLLFGVPASAQPTDSFNANLDENCRPDDIIDILRGKLTPRTFWEEQKKDFEYFIRSAKNNIENTMILGMRNKKTWLKRHNAELKWAQKCMAVVKKRLKALD